MNQFRLAELVFVSAFIFSKLNQSPCVFISHYLRWYSIAMGDVPPQLVILARRFLAAINEAVEAIRDQTRARSAAHEREREQEPPSDKSKKVRAVVSFDNETVRQTQADQTRHHTTQNSIRNAAWCAFIAASIYALVAGYQAYQMQRATRAATSAAGTASAALQDAKNSFEVLNRPYVVITGNNGTPLFLSSKNTFDFNKADIMYGNIGKTPAYDAFLRSRFTIERFPISGPPRILTEPIEESFKLIDQDEATDSKYYSELPKIDLPPGVNASFVTEKLINGPLSEDDKTALGQTPNTIMLLCIGRIYYKGFDKTVSYQTDFCYYYFGPQPLTWHYCPTHNWVQ